MRNKIIDAFFMKAPHPMTITRADDGTYVEINEAAARYMGIPRSKIIGYKSTELGHIPQSMRSMILREIKAKGYARNIELELKPVKNEIRSLLFSVFELKVGRNSYLLSVVSDITKDKQKDEVLFRLKLSDTDRIREKLKQYKMSPRQREVAVQASCGYSNREIAEKMYLTENTVKGYVKKVYKAVGVNGRSELGPKILNWR